MVTGNGDSELLDPHSQTGLPVAPPVQPQLFMQCWTDPDSLCIVRECRELERLPMVYGDPQRCCFSKPIVYHIKKLVLLADRELLLCGCTSSMVWYGVICYQVEVLLSQFEWKSRDSPTETRLTDRYRSTNSL